MLPRCCCPASRDALATTPLPSMVAAKRRPVAPAFRGAPVRVIQTPDQAPIAMRCKAKGR